MVGYKKFYILYSIIEELNKELENIVIMSYYFGGRKDGRRKYYEY